MNNGANPNTGLADQLAPESTSGVVRHFDSRRYGRMFAALMFAACVALSVAGYLYFSDREAEVRATARWELNAIVGLKLRQVLDWKEERLADGRFFSRALFVAKDLQRLSQAPSSAEIRSEVMDWLALSKAAGPYSAVAFFDAGLKRIAAVPASGPVRDDTDRGYFRDAIRTKKVILTDLRQEPQSRRLRLDVVVPIFTGADTNRGNPLGVLAFEIDPRLFLFPLIQTWPTFTFSKTAETLLVERSGKDVVYWNVDHGGKAGTSCQRAPWTAPDLVAARFLNGEHGTIEGLDFRGVPVVAVARRIAGTGWIIEAKVNQMELYRAVWREMRTAILLPSTILLAIALLAMVLWRRRDNRFMQHELALE